MDDPSVYTDLDAVKALSDLDPEFAKLVKDLPTDTSLPDLQTKRADDRKASVERSNASLKRLDGTVKEYTKSITMRDGYMSEIRISEPSEKPTSGDCPLYVLFYGGGFMFGDNTQLSVYAHIVSKLLNAVVVLPSYRLAPENPFPAAPNDAWDTLEWLAANANSLGADPAAGFVVGGVSAGANMAAVAVQKAVSEGLTPAVTAMWLNIPCVLSKECCPAEEADLFISEEQNAFAYGLNAKAIGGVWQAYKPDPTSPLYTPFAATNPHKGIPPTYFQVAGADPLRDHGLIYERVLRKNGVKTSIDVYPGVPHGHFAWFPSLQLSKKSHADTLMGLAQLIGKEINPHEIMQLMVPPAAA